MQHSCLVFNTHIRALGLKALLGYFLLSVEQDAGLKG